MDGSGYRYLLGPLGTAAPENKDVLRGILGSGRVACVCFWQLLI